MNKFYFPLFLLLMSGSILFIQYNLDIPTIEDYENHLKEENKRTSLNINSYYQQLANNLLKLAQNQNTVESIHRFNQALNQFSPSIPADTQGLIDFHQNTYIPWLSDINRERTNPNQEPNPTPEKVTPQNNEDQEHFKSMVSIGVRSLLPSTHISIKLQNRFLQNNIHPMGSYFLYSGSENIPLKSGTDPAIEVYEEVHSQYHSTYFNFLRNHELYDIFLVSPENRLGREDSRVLYSAMKEGDFGQNLTLGPMSVTNLGKAYEKAHQADPGMIYLTEVENYLPSANRPAQFMSTPVYDGQEYVGVLIIQVNITYVQELMAMHISENNEHTEDNPDERMIVNEYQKVILSTKGLKWYETRHLRNEISTRNMESFGTVEVMNLYHEPVLAVYQPLRITHPDIVSEVNWRLISEITIDRINQLSVMNTIMKLKPLVLGLTALSLAWILYIFYRMILKRLRQYGFSLANLWGSIRGRLALTSLLLLLLLTGLFINGALFNQNKRLLVLDAQNKHLLTEQIENIYLQALALRLNTVKYLFGNIPPKEHDLTKDALETLVDEEYAIITTYLADTNIPLEDLRALTRTLAEMRLKRNQSLNQSQLVFKAFDSWSLLVMEMSKESERIRELYPEMGVHALQLNQISSTSLVNSHKIMLGVRGFSEFRSNFSDFKENMQIHLDQLEEHNINVIEIQRIFNLLQNQMDRFRLEMENYNLVYLKLKQTYEKYFGLLEEFREKHQLTFSTLSEMRIKVFEDATFEISRYGFRNFNQDFETEEELTDRVLSLTADQQVLMEEFQDQELELSIRLLEINEKQSKSINELYELIEKDTKFLEAYIKQQNKNDLLVNYLTILQEHLMEDVIQIGNYLFQSDVQELDNAFLDGSSFRNNELIQKLEGAGLEFKSTLEAKFQKRKRLMNELMQTHSQHIGLLTEFMDLHDAFLQKANMSHHQHETREVLETYQEMLEGYNDFDFKQLILFILTMALFVFLNYKIILFLNIWHLENAKQEKALVEKQDYEIVMPMKVSEFTLPLQVVGILKQEILQLQQNLQDMQSELRAAKENNNNLQKYVELANSRKLDSQIVEMVSSSIVVVDPEGRILMTNPSFLRMFHLHKHEVEEQLISLVHEGMFDFPVLRDSLASVRQTGLPIFNIESDFETENQEELRLNISISIQETEDNQDQEVFFITMEDITKQSELKEKQEELYKVQSEMSYQAGMNEMSVNVMHNIGNAAGSVLVSAENLDTQQRSLEQFIQMLKEISELEDHDQLKTELKETLDALKEFKDMEFSTIGEEIRHGLDYINEIIRIQQQMASGDQGTLVASSFYISDVIDNSILLQKKTNNKYGIEINSTISEKVPELILPQNQVAQVLDNLLKNSREAILERSKTEMISGEITIDVRSGRHDDIVLSVEDNGCGIATDKLKVIFKHGHSTKARSSGFGLHSVANFVQSIGGTIVAKSEGKNKGSLFEITLPTKLT